jgi:hypothetical protein
MTITVSSFAALLRAASVITIRMGTERMSLRPLRTFRIVAQKAHQRGADWIRLLLLQPMTGAIKHSVFLHSRASARSHHIDGARSHVHCPVTFSTKESRWHIYGAPGEEPKLGNQ